MGQHEAAVSWYAPTIEKHTTITHAHTRYRIRHRRAFIGLSSTLLALSVILLALSIVDVVVLNGSYNPPQADYVTPEPSQLNSYASVFFLFLTIPFVMTIWNSVELAFICKHRLSSKWIATSAGFGFCVWVVQLVLTGIYEWSIFTYEEPMGFELAWVTPIIIFPSLAVHLAYFIIGMKAVVADKKERKKQSAASNVMRETSLHTPVHTLSETPAAETIVTENTRPSTVACTRPPSYFSTGACSSGSFDDKKEELELA